MLMSVVLRNVLDISGGRNLECGAWMYLLSHVAFVLGIVVQPRTEVIADIHHHPYAHVLSSEAQVQDRLFASSIISPNLMLPLKYETKVRYSI